MRTLSIGGSASLKNYVKYNAKADKWFARGAGGDEVEVQRPTSSSISTTSPPVGSGSEKARRRNG